MDRNKNTNAKSKHVRISKTSGHLSIALNLSHSMEPGTRNCPCEVVLLQILACGLGVEQLILKEMQDDEEQFGGDMFVLIEFHFVCKS